MSKQVDAAATRMLTLANARKLIKECTAEDCEFCEELQRTLDTAKQVDDLQG